jgi:hypothetical protein
MNNLEDFEVGASISGEEEFLRKCNEMIAAAGMTYEQASNFLGSMGVDAELEQTEVPVTHEEGYWIPATYRPGEPVSVGDARGTGVYN